MYKQEKREREVLGLDEQETLNISSPECDFECKDVWAVCRQPQTNDKK